MVKYEHISELRVCPHKWKIIRAEEGKEESLLGLWLPTSMRDVIIYHIQCEKCGELRQRHLGVCKRDKPYTSKVFKGWEK